MNELMKGLYPIIAAGLCKGRAIYYNLLRIEK